MRRRLLLDGDGRRQPVDLVDVRLLHHLEKLARIGRQALDIAPLALRIDRVEGERRLARAGQPGEHDELVARDDQVDVLEIVLARATDREDALILGGARDGAGAVEHVLELVGLGPCLARLFGPLHIRPCIALTNARVSPRKGRSARVMSVGAHYLVRHSAGQQGKASLAGLS